MFLNIKALNEIQNLSYLSESIFDFKLYFSDKYKKDLRSALKYIDQENKKLENKVRQLYKKNYSKSYKILKKYYPDIDFLNITENSDQIKKVFEKICDIEKDCTENEKKDFFNYIKYIKNDPLTLVFEDIETIHGNITIILINIPEYTVFDRLINNKDFYFSIFDHNTYVEFKRKVFLYHELLEAKAFCEKDFNLGNFFIRSNQNYYKVGNHYSIWVLIHEAILLNKLKHIKALNELRKFREEREWKIINALLGINLAKLDRLTPEIEKELNKKIQKLSKTSKIGDESGLFLNDYDLIGINLNEYLKNIKIIDNLNKVNIKGIKIKLLI